MPVAGGKKWPGAIFDVAQRRPAGQPPWTAGGKKTPLYYLKGSVRSLLYF
jgi:hypothetical protein